MKGNLDETSTASSLAKRSGSAEEDATGRFESDGGSLEPSRAGSPSISKAVWVRGRYNMAQGSALRGTVHCR